MAVAEDFMDRNLDLHEHLVKHPAATFFMRMKDDLLVVDRSIEARSGHMVVAVIDGEFVMKQLKKEDQENGSLEIWGVVTHIIHPCTPS